MKRGGARFFLGMVLAGLSGCAQISVQHLTPDGSAASGAAGLRYYLPKPYLLVTLLPPSSASTAPSTGSVQQKIATPPPIAPNPPPVPPGGPAAAVPPPAAGLSNPPGAVPTPQPVHTRAGAGAAQGQSTPGATTTPAGQTSAAPSTDTSFQANNDQYMVKLIYLPDLSNPMTINITAGLFGTASFQPTLQDGWMLTSLQGSTDNSQAVQLAESVISAAAGAGSKAATGGTTTKAGGGPTGSAALVAALLPPNTVLSPGLYAFSYDHSSGRLIGVCAVTYFLSGGNVPGDCPPSY
jgi:hypothetical protein